MILRTLLKAGLVAGLIASPTLPAMSQLSLSPPGQPPAPKQPAKAKTPGKDPPAKPPSQSQVKAPPKANETAKETAKTAKKSPTDDASVTKGDGEQTVSDAAADDRPDVDLAFGAFQRRDYITAFKLATVRAEVGSSRVDLQACKLEYSIVSPK